MKRPLLTLLVTLTTLSAPARANDGVAYMGTGGLVMAKSDGVKMVKEDLTVSTDRIEVAYVFRNISKKDVKTLVAFPLPDIDQEPDGDLFVDLAGKNPVGFTVEVDGKPVAFETEKKKVAKAKLQIKYFWEQTFPAGKDVTVRHSYRPIAGAVMIEYLSIPLFDLPGRKQLEPHERDEVEWVKGFCIDDDLKAWLKTRLPHPTRDEQKPGVIRTANIVQYVLTTGATWAGPIEDFSLTVKKAYPEQRVSLCLDGIKKTSPTTFEWRQKNFVPKQDLVVLFLPANRLAD